MGVSGSGSSSDGALDVDGAPSSNVVAFATAPAQDARIDALFIDGMALVEEAAAYLDGEGRVAARHLPPAVAAAYAMESMRLTTLLMNLSSWLIMRRSLSRETITMDEARRERARLRLDLISRPSHNLKFGELPDAFQALVRDVHALRSRVVAADGALFQPEGLSADVDGTRGTDVSRRASASDVPARGVMGGVRPPTQDVLDRIERAFANSNA